MTLGAILLFSIVGMILLYFPVQNYVNRSLNKEIKANTEQELKKQINKLPYRRKIELKKMLEVKKKKLSKVADDLMDISKMLK